MPSPAEQNEQPISVEPVKGSVKGKREARGFALYVKVSSTDYWAIERITMRFKSMGLVRRRM